MEGVTRESIRPLLELQRIDSGIDVCHRKLASLPEQQALDEAVAERDALAAQVATKQAELDGVVREQTKLEGEIEQVRAKADGEQKKLYSGEIANPRELSNIQAEIDALRRRVAHLEDQELDVMERREGIEGEATELRASLDQAEERVIAATANRDAARVEIDGDLATFAAQRDGIVPGLDAELLAFYDSLRQKFSGVAVAALEDKTCRACGLPLSPMAYDELKRNQDPLKDRCENCRRLLIVT